MIWWVETPSRSIREHAAVETLASSVNWLRLVGLRLDGTKLCWDADISTDERVYPVTLRYPDHFPHSPVLVLPRGVDERWSSHQYGAGGELCLEFGPDNWHSDITGADMLQSAHRLLSGEETRQVGGPEVATRHEQSLGQELRFASNRLFVPLDGQDMLSTIDEGIAISGTVLVLYRKGSTTFVLSAAGNGDSGWKASLSAPLVESSFSLPVRIVRVEADFVLPTLKEVALFREEWLERGVDTTDTKILIVIKNRIVSAFDLFSKNKAVRSSVILQKDVRTRRDENHDALLGRKVAIIGCGSLGSKVATTLTRSGVGHFILVDDDILFPENLVRNDLDWREIALHKVDGLAEKLQFANPLVMCECFKRNLGGQESSENIETLLGVLAACDLLIDCTANAAAFNYLCAVSEFAKKSVVWGEIFGGGFGGLIARSRYGLDPDPATMRHMILQWCDQQGRAVESSPGRYEGNEAEPEIADDAEVGAIAAHMALLALDTLIPRVPSAFPQSVYVIGLRAGWIFDAPFDTRPIDVGGPVMKEDGTVTDEDKRAEVERIIKLLVEYPNANSSAS